MADENVPDVAATAEAINRHLSSEVTIEQLNDIPSAPSQASEEEERQVSGMYEAMLQLSVGVNHMVVAKAVGVFMTALMHHSKMWRVVIPGFMNQMDVGATLALNHHQPKEVPPPEVTAAVQTDAEAKRERKRNSKLKLITKENEDGNPQEANGEDRSVEEE